MLAPFASGVQALLTVEHEVSGGRGWHHRGLGIVWSKLKRGNFRDTLWMVVAFTAGIILGMYYGGNLISLKVGGHELGFWVGVITGIIPGVVVGVFGMLKTIGRINHKA